MGFSINRASGHVVHSYDTMNVHGVASVNGYGFNITLEGDKGKVEQGEEISLKEIVLHLFAPEVGFIATAKPQQYPRAELLSFSSTPIHLCFQLTGSAIEKLEQIRSGRDFIEFEAKLGCIVSEPTEEEPRDREHVYAQSSKFTIASQQWLKALEQNGYRRSLYFEIGLPEIEDEKYKTVKTLISEAQNHLANGSYRSAVSTCRTILDSLEYKTDSKPDLRGLKQKYNEKPKDMTVAERLQFCKETIKHAAHLGAHADHDEEFSRSQAHAIFGMVVSIACCTGLDWLIQTEEMDS